MTAGFYAVMVLDRHRSIHPSDEEIIAADAGDGSSFDLIAPCDTGDNPRSPITLGAVEDLRSRLAQMERDETPDVNGIRQGIMAEMRRRLLPEETERKRQRDKREWEDFLKMKTPSGRIYLVRSQCYAGYMYYALVSDYAVQARYILTGDRLPRVMGWAPELDSGSVESKRVRVESA